MTNKAQCGCGCGCDHENTKNTITPTEATPEQKDFIHQLNHRKYMPVARFTLTDSKEADFLITALAPVYISDINDNMVTVKEFGAFLQKLEDDGYITLDYDIPLDNYDYTAYKNSRLYEYFCATVAEGASMPNFLGDTPVLELGSLALTEAGEKLATAQCGNHCE